MTVPYTFGTESSPIPLSQLDANFATIPAFAYTAGNVSNAAQPVITSVGTLTSLSVAGNVNGGNLSTAGLVLAIGSITGGNILTAGEVSAFGTITGGNITTSGDVAAENITSTNLIQTPYNIIGGNVYSAGIISAGGNILAQGILSATGNIETAQYFIGNFQGNITGNLSVGGSNTQVLFNNNGNVGAAGGLTYNSGSNTLGVLGVVSAQGNIVGGNLRINGTTQLVGVATAPTAALGTANNQIATTAFVGTTVGTLGTMARQNAVSVAITGGTIGNGIFTLATISSSNISDSNISGGNISGGNISGVAMSGSNISGSNISGGNISGVAMSGSNISGGNISGVAMSGSNISGSNISGGNISGVAMSGSNISGSNISGGNISGVAMSGGNISGVAMSGSNISGSNISGGNISGVAMSGGNISGGNISGVAMSGSNISGGNISGLVNPIAVADGGTNSTTLPQNAVILGNGVGALKSVSPGTSGNLLVDNGTTWVSQAPTSAIVGLGFGGTTWHDVTGSRAQGVLYTNSHGYPISVSICFGTNNDQSWSFYVDGVRLGFLQEHQDFNGAWMGGIVPPGSTYQFNGNYMSTWAELY